MKKNGRSRWKIGFSALFGNWRMQNSAVPFSAESYRRTEAVNSQLGEAVMDRVFKRIENACSKPRG